MRNNAAEKLLSTANSQCIAFTEDAFAEYMDSEDPLGEHREKYHLMQDSDGNERVYLCGNSMGLQHKDVDASANAMLKKWREQGVKGNVTQPNPWSELDNICRREMASIVGAQENEVVIMNSLTVNLHFLLMAFFKPSGERRKILTESRPFASGTNALTSQMVIRGLDPVQDIIYASSPSHESWEQHPVIIKTDEILSAIEKHGEEIAVVIINAVHYITGQVFDIPVITQAAHAKGILVGLDCSHAAGNIPLSLHDWDVDFAFWCTYKYLNSGPGNLGAAFVHSKHMLPCNELKSLGGWWGHEVRNMNYSHSSSNLADGAEAFQVSLTPALGMMTLVPSVRHVAQVGMQALREKSLLLTAYMELLLNELVPPGVMEVITPVDPKERGAQISIRLISGKIKQNISLTESYKYSAVDETDADLLERQLSRKNIIVDHYPPDIIRLAPVPMYNSFTDVLMAVRGIADCF